MRVLILTQWFQPEPAFKGLPFARALADAGMQVQALTGFPNYPGGKLYPGYKVKPWQIEHMHGIDVLRTPLYPSHDQSGLLRAVNYLSFMLSTAFIGPFLVKRPDVIYIYNLVTLATVGLWFRLLWGCKLVLDVQDLWPESVLSSGMLSNAVAKRLLARACAFVYQRMDHTTVLSPGFKQQLTARGVDAARIDVIYNWCDEAAHAVAHHSDNLAHEIGVDGRFIVLFAGTMGVMQDLDTVLNAATLCRTRAPSVVFVLVGGGIDRERLEARVINEGLENVVFVARQPPEKMGGFFALADVLLVTLRDDPLFRITIPSKTQAYLHAGKPVLMAVAGDAATLIESAHAGETCSPGDPQALAAAVIRLAELTPEARQLMGACAGRFYAEHLSMQQGVKGFVEIFLRLRQ